MTIEKHVDLEGVLPSEEEVVGYLDSLSNWERWGADDTLGTLHHVTPQVRVAAAGLVRTGEAISCSWEVSDPGRRTEVFGDVGEGSGDSSRALVAMEDVSFRFHGWEMTHFDALSHMFWEGRTYGGHGVDTISDGTGATRHAVTAFANGIVTRGVLVDVPGFVGEVPAGAAISPETLDAVLAHQGVEVRSGDAVLIRTGHGIGRARGDEGSVTGGARSGLNPRCLPWLHEHEVALLGSDATHDPEPFRYISMPAPVHTVGIVAMGMPLVDNLELETLAQACARAGRYEFLFSVAPLRMDGVTGSPVNPLAIL